MIAKCDMKQYYEAVQDYCAILGNLRINTVHFISYLSNVFKPQ